MELISIIIPVYNVEKYLNKCIESIVNQTYKNLEIILVDDGSPDNCPKICDEWAKKDNRINMVLCNAENVTKGKGLSLKHYKELKALGIAGMSMGNHTFSKSEIKDYINDATICRPLNLNTEYGKGCIYIKYNNEKIALINLMGRVFLNTPFLSN